MQQNAEMFTAVYACACTVCVNSSGLVMYGGAYVC